MQNKRFNIKDYATLALMIILGNKNTNAQVVYADLDPDSIIESEYADVDLDLYNNLVGDFRFRKFPLGFSNTSDIICYSNKTFEMGTLCLNNYIIGESLTFDKDIVTALNYGYLINDYAQFNADGWQHMTIKRQDILPLPLPPC